MSLLRNKRTSIMKNFTTRMINRKVEISFDHKNFVLAIFKAQSTSWSCQGQWKTECVSIPIDEYSLEALEAKVNKAFNVHYY